jgi:hypothetical protein
MAVSAQKRCWSFMVHRRRTASVHARRASYHLDTSSAARAAFFQALRRPSRLEGAFLEPAVARTHRLYAECRPMGAAVGATVDSHADGLRLRSIVLLGLSEGDAEPDEPCPHWSSPWPKGNVSAVRPAPSTRLPSAA